MATLHFKVENHGALFGSELAFIAGGPFFLDRVAPRPFTASPSYSQLTVVSVLSSEGSPNPAGRTIVQSAPIASEAPAKS
jgi:hypothetical protein